MKIKVCEYDYSDSMILDVNPRYVQYLHKDIKKGFYWVSIEGRGCRELIRKEDYLKLSRAIDEVRK